MSTKRLQLLGDFDSAPEPPCYVPNGGDRSTPSALLTGRIDRSQITDERPVELISLIWQFLAILSKDDSTTGEWRDDQIKPCIYVKNRNMPRPIGSGVYHLRFTEQITPFL